MSDPKEIFLQPECCADSHCEGRMWCEDDAPIDCEDGNPWTRYVLASEHERLRRKLAEARELLREVPDGEPVSLDLSRRIDAFLATAPKESER